jgi:hypothetical protein
MGSVTDVGYTSAHVSGTVDPHEGPSATTYYFQYSTEPSNPDAWNIAYSTYSETSVAKEVEGTIESLAPGTEYAVRLFASNEFEANKVASEAPYPTFTTKVVAAPKVTMEPTQVTGTSAHFEGTINPQGTENVSDLFWHFQCTPDCPLGSGQAPYDKGFGQISADNADHTVRWDPTGLAPNTQYEVTLIADNAGPEVSAGPKTFTTDKVAPQINPRWASSVDTDSAILAAALNPRNSTVTYQFEWGTDTSYGNVTPLTPAAPGASDNTFHTVTAASDGLQEGTTYHYRLVATNTETSEVTEGHDRAFTTLEVAGPPAPCPNAQFRTGPSALLPDCRAYEQVSPVDKNGNDAGNIGDLASWAGGVASRSGDAVSFASAGSFAGSPRGGNGLQWYHSRRTSFGWSTSATIPAADDPRPGYRTHLTGLAVDLSKSLFEVTRHVAPGDGPDNNWYYRDNASGALEFAFALPPNEPLSSQVNDDLSHIAFTSQATLTAEPNQFPEGFQQYRVYVYSANGLELVSRQPGTDEPFQQQSVLGGENPSSGTGPLLAGAVSRDGGEIFFQSPYFGPAEVYRRSEGTTQLVSPSRRSTPDPNGSQGKYFQAATPDGNRIFFSSVEALTDDANGSDSAFTGDLYRYDVAEDQLIDLSAGTIGPSPAEFLGLVDYSEDGKRAYFTASGQVVPGEGTAGQPNLYLWEDDGTSSAGQVRFIATLSSEPGGFDPADRFNWRWGGERSAQATPDGETLVFQSKMNLTGFDQEGTTQVYRFDAGADELTCLSCGSSAPLGSSLPPIHWNAIGIRGSLDLAGSFPGVVSDDGQAVLFTSPNALLSRDTNDQSDAYLWERGELHLLSTGSADSGSYALGLTPSGNDGFFRTRQQLVPQDNDTTIDIYTARVDGGLLGQQNQVLPECEGEACRGASSGAPAAVRPATSSFSGDGDGTRPKTRIVAIHELSRADRARLARGGKARLEVKVNRAGTLRLRGTAKIGNERRGVASASAKTKEPGMVRIPFGLSRAALSELARRGFLSVRLTVRFRDADPKVVRLALRAGATQKGGRS